MKYLKYFGEAKKINTDDIINKFRMDSDPYNLNEIDSTKSDDKIIQFNNKLERVMTQIGLKYEYNPIYRNVKKKRNTCKGN